MKHYKEVTSTRKELEKITCDICGNDLNDWTSEGEAEYINQVEISHHKLETFFGGPVGKGKSLKPDICGDCFENKIYPFLKSIGLKEKYSDEK